MTAKLQVSSSPHIRSGRRTAHIMRDVLIALIPTSFAGIAVFGWRAAAVILFSVAGAVLSEMLYCFVRKCELTIPDLSAAVTGLLVGLSLPANIPLWQAVFGSVFAVLLVKCVFGGIGYNITNPAVCARVVMLLSFGELATAAYPVWADTVSGATPLAYLADSGKYSLTDLFWGIRGGAIGEACTAALLAGLAYLLIRRVITWHIPVSFIGAVFLLSFLYEGSISSAAAWTMAGSVVLGAVFMATDYVTSPSTSSGKLLFGALCGALTVLIRLFGNYPEGVSFAILFMNFTVPFIDILTRKRVFGGGRG